MEKANQEDDATLYLCKLDDYIDLEPQDKIQLSKILEIFDTKNTIEKAIIKSIIENEYANNDTTITITAENKESKTVTFAKSAKQQIIDKYKFPGCVEYLVGFEEAMFHYSTEKGNSGVKSTKRNNEKQKYKIEVKLAGENDRLFSSKNDYYFDIYSPTGLH